MTDPIADMLCRIRNALAVDKEVVEAPYSILKYKIVEIFVKRGFVVKVEKRNQGKHKIIRIHFNKKDKKGLTITGLKRVSTPGRRVYRKWNEIKKVRNGYGMVLVSTSSGIFTGEDARKKKIGGEIITEIW